MTRGFVRLQKLFVLGLSGFVVTILGFASAIFSADAALAADDSAVNAQSSASPPSAEKTVNNKVTSHVVYGAIVSHEYAPSSTLNPKARCRSSSLTQEKFLEMLHAIIKHGDLSDKAFIERTLQIKFGIKHKSFEASHTPDAGFYYTSMPGDISSAPIVVSLYLGGLSKNKAGILEVEEGLVFERLDMVGAVFQNCKYLTKKEFQQKFNFALHEKRGVYSETQNLGKVGKNGSNISIDYLSRRDDGNFIKQVIINQQSEAHQN